MCSAKETVKITNDFKSIKKKLQPETASVCNILFLHFRAQCPAGCQQMVADGTTSFPAVRHVPMRKSRKFSHREKGGPRPVFDSFTILISEI